MLKIWQKYLFKQVLGSFLFILSILFFLYVLIDVSEKKEKIVSFYYYWNQFLIHFDFFSPLAFLLASLKTLFHLHRHQETVALQMAGLSKKQILTSFWGLAFLLTVFSYLNGESWVPKAKTQVEAVRESKKTKTFHLHRLVLENHSELFYQNYDRKTGDLIDCLWVYSPKEVWRMATLNLVSKKASQVHELKCVNHQWTRLSYTEEKILEHLQFEKKSWDQLTSVQNRPLHVLFSQWQFLPPEQAKIHAHFFYQLLRPSLPLWIVYLLSGFGFRFSRNRSPFLEVAGSVGAFFGFMTILDGMLLIGETGLISGAFAIGGPFFGLACIGWLMQNGRCHRLREKMGFLANISCLFL